MIRHVSQENNNDFVRLLTFLADPIVPCCDLCDPTLLDRTHPAPKVNQPKATTMKTGIVNKTVRSALQQWRSRIWQRDFEDALFAPSGILSDEHIDNLSSVGPIGRLNKLERVVGMDWPWFGQYGDTLLEELEKLNIPPMQPKQQKKAEKQTVSELEDEQSQPASKKKRGQKQDVATPTQNPTPTAVNPVPPSRITAPAPPPAPISTPHLYSTPYRYATPQQQTYNPYSSLTYPYAMYPPSFYGYYQTPMQVPAPNPQIVSNGGPQDPNV